MKQAKQIIFDIKSGKLAPIYFLMGDEPYYIDLISTYIENNVLSDQEKSFDQIVLYGRDTTLESIVSQAKCYPVLAKKQIIIIREAQELSRNIDNLLSYAKQPQDTTVLIICYKYKKLNKTKKLAKAIQSNGVLFEGKKLYENQVIDWISEFLGTKEYKIEPKASLMLVNFLGTDLTKISNEINKLLLVLPDKHTIDSSDIQDNIGISKDYNNFELRRAIGEKDAVKAYRIVDYFCSDSKNHPLVLTLSVLYNFFTQLFIYHTISDKSKVSITAILKIHPFFISEYQRAAINYPMRNISNVISILRETDLKSKGVNSGANLSTRDILKELVFKLIN